VAGAGLLGLARRALEWRRDEANVRRLAVHLRCTSEDARRVYDLSRQVGFGAAHEAVFGIAADAT
jgi:hypothetical protein